MEGGGGNEQIQERNGARAPPISFDWASVPLQGGVVPRSKRPTRSAPFTIRVAENARE